MIEEAHNLNSSHPHLHTEKSLHQFLSLLSAGRLEEWSALWDDDAVQLMPYAPEGFPDRLEGRERIVRHYRNVLANKVDGVRFSDIRVFASADGSLGYAQYRGESINRSTGRTYRQQYAGLFEFRDGRIARWTEYFNPLPFVLAYDGGHNAAQVAGAVSDSA